MSVSEIDHSKVSLLPSISSSELTILLGAGASAYSGLPNWEQMVANLLVEVGVLNDPDSSRLACNKGDLVMLAEAVRRKCEGEQEWVAMLSQALYGGKSYSPFPSTMQLNAAWVACENLGRVHLATLNFDQLLEQAITQTIMELDDNRMAAIEGSAGWEDALRVTHLHGEVPLPESDVQDKPAPIFCFGDYLDLLHSEKPAARTYLESALSSGSLLLAGTSFRDPDMRQWLADILRSRQSASDGNACILLAREGFSDIEGPVDKEVFSKITPALTAQWQSVGFTPVFVDDFEDVSQLIRECSYKDRPNYLAPADRVERFWKWATSKRIFEAMQKGCAARLLDNVDELKSLLAIKGALNATFWIARRDRLTRYASHDRIYTNSKLLRYCEIGFDSSIIAGQSYGANDVRLFVADSQRPSLGRWKTVVACPVAIQPQAPGWYTALPVGVLSIGIEHSIRELDKLSDSVIEMAECWGGYIENLIEASGAMR